MLRVEQNRPALLRLELRNYDGDLFDPDGTVTVTVLNAAGAPYLADYGYLTDYATYADLAAAFASYGSMDGWTGVATQLVDGVDPVVGVFTFPVPGEALTELGAYSALVAYTVAGGADQYYADFETVGRHLFTIADLRVQDPAIADTALYPAEAIRSARDAAAERMETAAKVAFTSQRATVTDLVGDGTTRLLLPHGMVTAIDSVTVDGVSVDTSTLTFNAAGWIDNDNRWTADAPISATYVHGYIDTPEPVRRAAMLLAVEYLVPTALPARATSQSTDLGEFRVSVANPDVGRYTGIPEVDAVIGEYGLRRPPV